eukprot:CAMPEP_0201587726 /NCGR_PEP_ID=MMETSP0190_2-20130828/146917_1 /ASSEMBLY_ACC=CAM_ASM_000263 /TAXON_ID=37353 /ORGANISM="Rosalina sp." /LENGTH=129 /DNA_ID=CAMNT_0048038377 /DNA_START=185 /DNA_END=574 /DNA_ORIENTATION=+
MYVKAVLTNDGKILASEDITDPFTIGPDGHKMDINYDCKQIMQDEFPIEDTILKFQLWGLHKHIGKHQYFFAGEKFDLGLLWYRMEAEEFRYDYQGLNRAPKHKKWVGVSLDLRMQFEPNVSLGQYFGK